MPTSAGRQPRCGNVPTALTHGVISGALPATDYRAGWHMVDKPSGGIVEADVALDNELNEIEQRRRAAGVAGAASAAGETRPQRAERLGLTALCLSGGGIRSAAFCLGVLQSLARRRLLNEFDYLSSVSGGGFIGGWLQVLIKESHHIDLAQAELERNNPSPLSGLRGFTSYLTPQRGPMSADTWAAIVLYLRNLLLNWMVFTPAFFLLALSAVFYRTFLASLRDHPGIVLTLLVLATLSLLCSNWQACSLIPSHRRFPLDTLTAARYPVASSGLRWPGLSWRLCGECRHCPWMAHRLDRAGLLCGGAACRLWHGLDHGCRPSRARRQALPAECFALAVRNCLQQCFDGDRGQPDRTGGTALRCRGVQASGAWSASAD